MKKTVLAILALALCCAARGQEYSNDVAVSGISVTHDSQDLIIRMNLDFSRISLRRNESVIFTPVIFAGNNYAVLPAATIYSRGQYYHTARAQRTSSPFNPEEWEYYGKDVPATVPYVAVVAYRPWMREAKIRIDRQTVSCCGHEGRVLRGAPILSAVIPEPEPEPLSVSEPEPAVRVEPIPEAASIADMAPRLKEVPAFVPEFVYVLPEAEASVKQRDISGEAYVVFATGSSDVDPDYGNNAAELGKIRATIDSVRNDSDMTITRITLRGYSSPDGSYRANGKIAAERTAAIRDYVRSLYELPDDIFVPESIAENWDGLRQAVLTGEDFPNADDVLTVIDSKLDPDRKESRIRNSYPAAWQYLVKEVFPGLRRTDYKVGYTVRSYTTVEEARKIMETRPWNLGVNEFFLAAQGYEKGSEGFNRVFATASRYCPDNEVVNINVASAAMAEGKLDRASYYIRNVGDSPEARYTKGVFQALSGNWDLAAKYFTSAEVSGLECASGALEQVNAILSALAANAAAGANASGE